MNRHYEKLLKCYEAVRERVDFVPDAALVLGCPGWAGYAEGMEVAATIDYSEIEGFPVSTVLGHKGRFVFGYAGGVKVVAMQGRIHYYEGYDINDVVLPARLMKMLGAKVLFLTNASGGIREDLAAGDFMLIKDHIMCFSPTPLIGENIEELGHPVPGHVRGL